MSRRLAVLFSIIASLALSLPASAAAHHHHAHRARHHVALRSHAAGHRHVVLHGHAAAHGPCTDQSLAPNGEDLARVRQVTLCLINRERARHGERPLLESSPLQQAAQQHTQSMVSQDYFSHYSPNGEGPSQRMRAAGYIPSGNVGYEVGENIAWGTMGLATPQAIVSAWMRSPEHRANILDARYRETAIGVLAAVPASLGESQPGAIYTQDFGVIIAP